MQNTTNFSGGTMSLREPGEMYDQRTGRKTVWGRALLIKARINRNGALVVGREFCVKMLELLNDPEFQEWLKTAD